MSIHVTSRPTVPARSVIVRRTPTSPLTLEPRRRRDALLARLLAPWLDDRLAAGVVPESGRVLATRAAQLVDPRERRRLADAWDGLVVRASEPVRPGDPRVPIARRPVLAAAAEIAALAAVLRCPSPLSARDVVLARALLTDGTGPVHTGRCLRETVARLVDETTAARR